MTEFEVRVPPDGTFHRSRPTCLLALLVSLAGTVGVLAGCPSSQASSDDAALRDSGPPPDAGLVRDAAPVMDAEAAPDAEPTPDAQPTPDAVIEDVRDAEPAVDTGPADAGSDPCGPVPLALAPTRLAAALAVHAQRCNPELLPTEAVWFGARGAALFDTALAAPGVTYDPTEAGACACALEGAACDLTDPLLELTACRRALTGTIAIDQRCEQTAQCLEGSTCVFRGPAPTRRGVGGGTFCEPVGTCRPIVADGMGCGPELGECGPQSVCLGEPATCRPRPAVGDSCDLAPCRGGAPFAPTLPTTTCRSDKGGSVCEPLGRAGAECGPGGCHPLYSCDEATNTCVLRPGAGEACTLSIDVVAPNADERFSLMSQALFACRVSESLGGVFSRELSTALSGWGCVQTGTTTGRGTCLPLPIQGEACGLGANLAASCAGLAYCPGLDPNTQTSQAATCAPTPQPGEACVQDRVYGATCTRGAYCEFELSTCVELTCGL